MSDTNSKSTRMKRIEQGLNVVFTAQVTKEVLAAVDFEAILAGDPARDAVDVDRLAEAVGRPLGRALAQYVFDDGGKFDVVKRALGSEIGSRIAAETFRTATENVDIDAVIETLVELSESQVSEPPMQDAIDTYVENSDEQTADS
ncbi:hypothetical protein [Halogranum rubrum]|nr:hypothetical protein [Halogranum rubrum]